MKRGAGGAAWKLGTGGALNPRAGGGMKRAAGGAPWKPEPGATKLEAGDAPRNPGPGLPWNSPPPWNPPPRWPSAVVDVAMAAARQREATTAMMTVDRLILGPPSIGL